MEWKPKSAKIQLTVKFTLKINLKCNLRFHNALMHQPIRFQFDINLVIIIIRHPSIFWSISIRLVLVASHILPNFCNCWGDNLVLNMCLGLGILTGMQVCRFLEMREPNIFKIRLDSVVRN